MALRQFVQQENPEYVLESEDAQVRHHAPHYTHRSPPYSPPTPQRHHPPPTTQAGYREFFVSFYNFPLVDRIRALRTERVGRLLSVSGTVTRTSEVRPELLFGSFTCSKCGLPEKDVPQQFQYSKPHMCKNPACNNANEFDLDIESSRFVDWQRVRVQENSDEIPAGTVGVTIRVTIRVAVI